MKVDVLDCKLLQCAALGSWVRHTRTQVLAVFSRAHRIGERRRDSTNREQIAKTTSFYWSDRQMRINAKRKCTDWGKNVKDMEKPFCTITGMSWLSCLVVHAGRERRAAAAPKSNAWAPASVNRSEENMNLISAWSASVLLSHVPLLELMCIV